MNRERGRELLAALDELVVEVTARIEELREAIEEPDVPPPASRRKSGPGSLLVLEDNPPVDDWSRAKGRRAVRKITGQLKPLVGRKP